MYNDIIIKEISEICYTNTRTYYHTQYTHMNIRRHIVMYSFIHSSSDKRLNVYTCIL